jgi:hypothetical protein
MNATVIKETITREVFVVLNKAGDKRGICQTGNLEEARISRDRMNELAPDQGPFRVEMRWSVTQQWAKVVS